MMKSVTGDVKQEYMLIMEDLERFTDGLIKKGVTDRSFASLAVRAAGDLCLFDECFSNAPQHHCLRADIYRKYVEEDTRLRGLRAA